jgi:hypothetical protein
MTLMVVMEKDVMSKVCSMHRVAVNAYKVMVGKHGKKLLGRS